MDYVYKSAKQRLSPRDAEFIAEWLPYVKWATRREDVERSLMQGACGIKNQLRWSTTDGDLLLFDPLQEVAEAVNKRVPIVWLAFVGQHVLKPGFRSRLVAIGRPVIYGLPLVALVRQVFEHLNDELDSYAVIWNMTIEDVKRFKLLCHNPYDPSFQLIHMI